mmetsp:Transcript_58704/g.174694  ORF Transcript_58704/g.174694 Transcript_58704/m.174694 type:complete len:109 (+) Transcript_58704:18-344(+)
MFAMPSVILPFLTLHDWGEMHGHRNNGLRQKTLSVALLSGLSLYVQITKRSWLPWNFLLHDYARQCHEEFQAQVCLHEGKAEEKRQTWWSNNSLYTSTQLILPPRSSF